jgi:hypothetical protein
VAEAAELNGQFEVVAFLGEASSPRIKGLTSILISYEKISTCRDQNSVTARSWTRLNALRVD